MLGLYEKIAKLALATDPFTVVQSVFGKVGMRLQKT